jgi:hypothetical protein
LFVSLLDFQFVDQTLESIDHRQIHISKTIDPILLPSATLSSPHPAPSSPTPLALKTGWLLNNPHPSPRQLPNLQMADLPPYSLDQSINWKQKRLDSSLKPKLVFTYTL